MPDVLIRPATVRDIDAIFRLTNENARRGLMLARSKYKIVSMLRNFLVAEASGEVVACGALTLLWTDCAEIMALAVDAAHQHQGIGSRLVAAIEVEAANMKVPELITLTYQDGFFRKHGYAFADKDGYPRKLWRECLECSKLEACDEMLLRKEIPVAP